MNRYVVSGLCLLMASLVSCGGGGDAAPMAVEPPPETPPPERVTLTFAGTWSCGSTANGTFSYLKEAAILGSNVRGLSPNVTYALTSWSFTAESQCDGLPSSTFTNGEPGQVAEFCVGICQFSTDRVIQLSLTNQTDNVVMQLIWTLPEPATLTPPPADLAAYGPFQQSLYRVPCPICSPVGVFQTGVLNAPPPPGRAPAILPSP